MNAHKTTDIPNRVCMIPRASVWSAVASAPLSAAVSLTVGTGASVGRCRAKAAINRTQSKRFAIAAAATSFRLPANSTHFSDRLEYAANSHE
jgi:hypothetical protein